MVVSVGLLSTGPAAAIDIVLNYAPPAGNTNTTLAADPGAVYLQSMMAFAEAFYEDVFEDIDHTLTVEFYYDDLSSGILGLHNLLTEDPGPPHRQTAARVTLDSRTSPGVERDWFIDTTFTNHSEFNLTQTLYRDLSPTVQSDYLLGTVPGVFEVGYVGNTTVSPASTRYDLFSVVMHEVGHSLGLSGDNDATIAEAKADLDFDLSSAWLRGVSGVSALAFGSGQFNHTRGPLTMMFPTYSVGQRRLPSTIDLLAMATVHQYMQVDLPRKDFLAASSSNTWVAANWLSNRNPDTDDEAFIRDAVFNPVVELVGTAQARRLTIADGDGLRTDVFKLNVVDRIDVIGAGSTLRIDGISGQAETDTLSLFSGAQLRVSNGGLADVDTLSIGTGSELRSEGGIGGSVSVTTLLNNDGTLRVRDGGTLTLTDGLGSPAWDLDGSSESGQVIIETAGRLHVANGSMSDAFNGRATIQALAQLTTQADLTIGNGGTLALFNQSETNGPGLITVTPGGDLNATDAIARIDNPLLLSGGSLNLGNTELSLGGSTTFAAGTVDAALLDTIFVESVLSPRQGVTWLTSNTASRVDIALTAQLDSGSGSYIAVDTVVHGLHAFNPAAPGKTANFARDLQYTSSATLALSASGPLAEGFDRVFVTGDATLGGELDLSGLYAAVQGDGFTVLDATNRAGTFDVITGIGGGAVRWATTYTATGVHITGALAGDMDLDSDVDFFDATGLRFAFTGTLSPGSGNLEWNDGDFDGDRDIDLDDALSLRNNFTGFLAASTTALLSDAASISMQSALAEDEPAVWIDVITGQVTLMGDAVSMVAWSLRSSSGSLLGADALQGSLLLNTAQETSAMAMTGDLAGMALSTLAWWDPSASRDVEFFFAQDGDWASTQGIVHYVPEPTAYVLVALGGLWLSRRTMPRAAHAVSDG